MIRYDKGGLKSFPQLSEDAIMTLSISTNVTTFQTSMASDEGQVYNHNAGRYIAPMVLCFTFTIGVLGNLSVIAIIGRQRAHQLHPVFPRILQNMAFADLLLLVFVCPLSALEFAQETWNLGDILCQIVRPVEFVVQMVTSLNWIGASLSTCLDFFTPSCLTSTLNS